MTVSQVWAFWPPPCRNTTCGSTSPHVSALMGPEWMRATGSSGPVAPICSAFSGSRANSSRPSSSSSEISGIARPYKTPVEIAPTVRIGAEFDCQRYLDVEGSALDERLQLRARDVVGHLLGRALHEVRRRGLDRSADATVQRDLRRTHRVD